MSDLQQVVPAALSSAAEVTPDWLTDVLRRHESLAGARVTGVTVESSSETLLSTIATLSLTYARAAPAGAPTRLFLKMSKDESRAYAARKEVEFYRTIAPAMADPPTTWTRYGETTDWLSSSRSARRCRKPQPDCRPSSGGAISSASCWPMRISTARN